MLQVIITANLHEGSVRQFGGLPLALFDRMRARPSIIGQVHDTWSGRRRAQPALLGPPSDTWDHESVRASQPSWIGPLHTTW